MKMKKNLLKKKWKLADNKKIILLPGRLTSWKGQEMFIEALNNLKNESNIEHFIAII